MTEVVKVTINGADDDTIIFTGGIREAYELLGGMLGKAPKPSKDKVDWKEAYGDAMRLLSEMRRAEIEQHRQSQQTIQWTPAATTYEGINRSINAEWASRITETFNAPSPFYTITSGDTPF